MSACVLTPLTRVSQVAKNELESLGETIAQRRHNSGVQLGLIGLEQELFDVLYARTVKTADEARARMNLPSLGGDAEVLVTPLNVLIGGQASPRDSAPSQNDAPKRKARGLDTHLPLLRQQHEKKWVEVLSRHYRRQEAAMMSRLPESVGKTDIGGVWWDDERWNNELTSDLFRLNVFTAGTWATMMANAAGPVMIIYLLAMRLPKFHFVGTSAWFFFIVNWLKVPFQARLELMTWDTARLDLMMLPAIAVGAAIGIFVLKRIPQKAFNIVVQVLSAAAAVKLLF